jgi:hypothetical protein
MDTSAAPAPSFPPDQSRQPSLEVRVRVPAPLLVEIDALIGQRYLDRAEAVRALLYAGLRSQP